MISAKKLLLAGRRGRAFSFSGTFASQSSSGVSEGWSPVQFRNDRAVRTAPGCIETGVPGGDGISRMTLSSETVRFTRIEFSIWQRYLGAGPDRSRAIGYRIDGGPIVELAKQGPDASTAYTRLIGSFSHKSDRPIEFMLIGTGLYDDWMIRGEPL